MRRKLLMKAASGAMAKGELTVDNAECYFDETTGRLFSVTIKYEY